MQTRSQTIYSGRYVVNTVSGTGMGYKHYVEDFNHG